MHGLLLLRGRKVAASEGQQAIAAADPCQRVDRHRAESTLADEIFYRELVSGVPRPSILRGAQEAVPRGSERYTFR
jgi:hypothetical protein